MLDPLSVWRPVAPRPLVIADLGKNFIVSPDDQPVDSYIERACALIDAAAEAGVDAVKFQTHCVDDEQMQIDIVSPHFKGSDRYSWVRRNMLATPPAFWRAVQAHAGARRVHFMTTPMSRQAARNLTNTLPTPPLLWKVGSGDVDDLVLLDYLAGLGQPVIISTGMVSLTELDHVVAFLRGRAVPVAILYCISRYPCPAADYNLASLAMLGERYPGVPIGLSDHSLGIDVSLAAVRLGARVIEKHFSFARDLWGADHKVSMTPAEMRSLTTAIRDGAWRDLDPTPWLRPVDAELEGATNEFRPYFKKTLVAARDLPAGTRLDDDALYAMRPRMYLDGLPAGARDTVVGRCLTRPLARYTPIREADLT